MAILAGAVKIGGPKKRPDFQDHQKSDRKSGPENQAKKGYF